MAVPRRNTVHVVLRTGRLCGCLQEALVGLGWSPRPDVEVPPCRRVHEARLDVIVAPLRQEAPERHIEVLRMFLLHVCCDLPGAAPLGAMVFHGVDGSTMLGVPMGLTNSPKTLDDKVIIGTGPDATSPAAVASAHVVGRATGGRHPRPHHAGHRFLAPQGERRSAGKRLHAGMSWQVADGGCAIDLVHDEICQQAVGDRTAMAGLHVITAPWQQVRVVASPQVRRRRSPIRENCCAGASPRCPSRPSPHAGVLSLCWQREQRMQVEQWPNNDDEHRALGLQPPWTSRGPDPRLLPWQAFLRTPPPPAGQDRLFTMFAEFRLGALLSCMLVSTWRHCAASAGLPAG